MHLKWNQVKNWRELNHYLTVDIPKLRNNTKLLEAYHTVSTASYPEIRTP